MKDYEKTGMRNLFKLVESKNVHVWGHFNHGEQYRTIKKFLEKQEDWQSEPRTIKQVLDYFDKNYPYCML